MSCKIQFSKEQKEHAKKIDLADFLIRQGATLKQHGKEQVVKVNGEDVFVKGNVWYSFYGCRGGNTVGFVMTFYNKTYPEALEFLLCSDEKYDIFSEPLASYSKRLFYPPRNGSMRRVFAYLINNRGIDRDIVYAFAHNDLIYESALCHNVVFVGYDRDKNIRHIHERSTGRRGRYRCTAEGSVAEYSFHWNGSSEKIYLFEAPIDMMSYISLHKDNWKENSYAASCSVSDRVLIQCLKDNPNLKEIYICFDNDTAGQNNAKRIADKLSHLNVKILVPTHKDWNEDLLFSRKEGANV